jgi:hypothetical protein
MTMFFSVMGTASKNGSKDGTIHSFRGSDFYRDFHQSQEGNFKCRIDLLACLQNLKDLLVKNSMQLAINMDLDKTVNIYSLYLSADPPILAPNYARWMSVMHLLPGNLSSLPPAFMTRIIIFK